MSSMIDTEVTKEKIKALAEKYELSLVVLFGSQATGRIHSKSDVDIAVLAKSGFDKFKILEDVYDIFEREDVEVVDLDEAEPAMMRVLVEEGLLLYEDSPEAFFKWQLYAIRVWLDTVEWNYSMLNNLARIDVSN